MRVRAVKGTYDVLPERQPVWRHLRGTVERVLGRAGVREIVTPVFEHSDVFDRSVGDSADLVVQKEMYRFEDRGGRSLTLRPEFTAGVLRAFVDHGMHTRPTPVKLWSLGPAFRAENVQRGRYRQFHQVNCEFLGLPGPLIDAEAIALLHDLLAALGLSDLRVALGSVGDPEDREAYNAYLREALTPVANELSDASRARLRLNPMRVLDSKEARDQELLAGLDKPLDRLGDAARAHLDAVAATLDAWGIAYELAPDIVRGLDYYRRTAFEIHAEGIGAQSALAGGGRYDGLVAALGGPPTPGIGWAVGVERVLDALDAAGALPGPPAGPDLFLVPMDDPAVAEAATLARELRGTLHVEHAYARRAPGKGLRDADRAGARYAALRGERERERGAWTLKHLARGDQREVEQDALAAAVREE
ncbi:MAG: histidine--tRNA ligase [Trueperaceae bacterium]|nr:histidine--tRNA ligase [Trueperaceae bacterium]